MRTVGGPGSTPWAHTAVFPSALLILPCILVLLILAWTPLTSVLFCLSQDGLESMTPLPSGLSPEGQASYPHRIPAELPFSSPSLSSLESCSLCLPLQDLSVWLSFLPPAACLPVAAASTVSCEGNSNCGVRKFSWRPTLLHKLYKNLGGNGQLSSSVWKICKVGESSNV